VALTWISRIAALSQFWPWAVGAIVAAALAYSGWLIKGWADKAARVDAAEIAAKASQTALEAERADRARVDLARLAASSDFRVTVQGYEAKTTVLMRETVRYVPDDRPCLPQGAVDALNAGRK
jgi:hypothetical protein